MKRDRGIDTWEIPGLALAHINLGDHLDLGPDPPRDLALEVVVDQLLIGRVEPEP